MMPMGRADSKVLWLLAMLIAAEALAFGLAAQSEPLAVTRFSLAVAALALFTGLIPALLRPNTTTLLAACLAIVGASFLALPFDFYDLPRLTSGPLGASALSPLAILRLVNAMALGPLALHLAARFPVRSRLTGSGLAVVYAVSAALLLGILTAAPGLRLPLAIASFFWLLALLFGSLVQLFHASRGPTAVRAARQARLLLFIMVISYIPFYLRLLGFLTGKPLVSDEWLLAGQLIWPVGVAYTILRHDLFGIDAALRRGLAYGALSLALLAIYFGLTSLLTATLLAALPQFRNAAALVVLFAAAAAFNPLRGRAQWAIDRLFYPERLTFQSAVRAAQATLTTVVRRDEVTALLTDQLPRRLGAGWGALTLTALDAAPPTASAGPTPHPPAWSAPLVVGGRMLGHYELGPRPLGPPFDAEEQAQLQALTQQAALALAYAETFDALDALNRELETRITERTAQVVDQQRTLAVIETRQHLARDLHDSVTQTLFSISLGLRHVRNQVRRDPDGACAALTEQEAAARTALAEMRALLTQLRSPLVAESDLAAALRAHCAGLQRQHALHVTLDLPAACLLPAQMTNELLAVAREALHNVVKHSGASQAHCALTEEAGRLTLTVTDDGQGFDPAGQTTGLGLRGIGERVAALDGTVRVASTPGAGASVQVNVAL